MYPQMRMLASASLEVSGRGETRKALILQGSPHLEVHG